MSVRLTCIRELNIIEVRGRRKTYAARPQEDARHSVSKIDKEIITEIAIEDSKRCNIPVKGERLKTVSRGTVIPFAL